ncbi:hypothetical protein PR202_gb04619 [Eleusine coracana subsp. coracana]|uniref:Uncharacterized protein n=1 Tax=Eleusine coracana subsp. coracana TaxID=191504 RepID=A0AAV5E4A5_ELECO|nr:hypothetical protein PR202_gb04619 [Eleusine coracana subsp. coracana]
MTAEAMDSLTNPPRLANALRENPVHASGNHPPTTCTSCAALSSHHDTFPTMAAPTSPRPSKATTIQLSSACTPRTAPETAVMTHTRLCAW